MFLQRTVQSLLSFAVQPVSLHRCHPEQQPEQEIPDPVEPE